MRAGQGAQEPGRDQGAVDAQRRDRAAVARFLAWLDSHDGSLDEIGAAAHLAEERARVAVRRLQLRDHLGPAPTPPCPTTASTRPSNRPLTTGTLYLVDSGGQYLDATTDITPTVALGTASPEMAERCAPCSRA
ncbi:MAG: M24 family metallopeptidase [Geminicoccaceae bacterium]